MTDPRARDGAETPVGSVVIGRDRRLRAQVGAVVAAGLLVVLVGIGLGSPPPGPAGSGAPTAALSGRPSAPASTSSTAGRATSPAATTAGCLPILTGNPPPVRLSSTSDDRFPVAGEPGPTGSGEPAGSATLGGWTVPGLQRGILLPSGTSLVLDAERSACIESVSVAIADAGLADPGVASDELRVIRLARPADRVDLGGLPLGDWVVRIVVRFQAGFTGAPAVAPREAFFRVVSGDTVVLAPSPQVTPAVACGTDPVGGPDPGLVLVVDDGPAIPQQVELDQAEPIAVNLGQAIEVRSTGDVCARGWSLEVVDGLGNAFLQESYPNPVDSPFVAAQNRWTLTQLLTGDSTVTATIRFGRGRVAVGAWRLRMATDGLPPARAVASDGSTVAALPGCGQYWALPGGVTAFEPCEVQTIPASLETLAVKAGEVVRVELPDWTIAGWFARCGGPVATSTGKSEFATLDSCDLGEQTSAGPIAFVPWPGDRIVLVGITAERDGVTAYGNFYVRVVATP